MYVNGIPLQQSFFRMDFVIMIEDIEKKNPYGLLGNLEVQICRGYLQHLSLHPDKQLNCGINHTKVMVSDKGPATLFYFF